MIKLYNLQVRYALGYDRLGDGDFEIRTLYYFRERLAQYSAAKGVNLVEKAFEQITDAQITALKVAHRHAAHGFDPDCQQHCLRQPTAIAGGGLSSGVQRILSEADQVRLAEAFAPYTQDSAGHYTYRVKGQEAVQATPAENWSDHPRLAGRN